MKLDEAKEYIAECRKDNGLLAVQELAELILWAYDKGWSEGIEDYREEKFLTEEDTFRKTR